MNTLKAKWRFFKIVAGMYQSLLGYWLYDTVVVIVYSHCKLLNYIAQ